MAEAVPEPVKRQSVHEIDREHAKLSASGSHRWLHCTASAWMELHFDDEGSEFADEGTRAHFMASECLSGKIGVTEWGERQKHQALDRLWHEATHNVLVQSDAGLCTQDEMWAVLDELSELRDEDNVPGYAEWLEQFEADYPAEMFDVVDGYIDFVHAKILEAKVRNPDCIVYVERRVDFSKWVPEGFGTADCIIISDGVITVIDLKYGKGVFVDVTENSQAMLYGAGSYNDFKHLFDMKHLALVIYQPRIGNIAQFDLSVKQLLGWLENHVKPIAKVVWHSMENDTLDGVEFDTSDVEQCRFCKARNHCRARSDEMMAMAQYEKDVALMKLPEIARLLPKAKHLKLWATNMEEFAQSQAVLGVKVPGFKLVEGRSNRRITHEGRAVNVLRAEGFKKEQLYKKPQVLGITALKELVHGEKKLYDMIGAFIDKPKGRPVLVPIDDPREVIDKVDAVSQGF